MNNDKRQDFGFIILAMALIGLANLLVGVKNTVVKYFFSNKGNNTDVVAIINFVNLIVNIPLAIIMGYMLVTGYKYKMTDLIWGNLGGFMALFNSILSSFVISKGKGGTSDALMQISFLFQALFDIFLYSRYPNMLEYIALAIA